METENKSTKKEEIHVKLDDLFERYLELVDEYDQLRDDLTKTMSTGFMSLAKANFSHNAHHGRYGQDYYDERMKAMRRITVKSDDPISMNVEKLQTREEAKREKRLAEEKKQQDAQSEKGSTDSTNSSTDQLPTPPSSRAASEVPELDSLNISDDSKASQAKEKEAEDDLASLSRDPLTWFGILVPPALRSAQASFATAIDRPLPRLAEVAREMRLLEIEIGRGRKELKKVGG